MKKPHHFLCLLLLLLLLSACNGVGDSQHGYLATGSGGVIFIQFVQNNEQLTGQLQMVSATNDGHVHSYNVALTGILSNGQISLSASWFGLSIRTVTGTYDGSTLILNYPDNNGHLNPIQFQSATVSYYNSAVDTFTSNVQATTVAAQNAQATAEEQSAESQATADAQQAESQATAISVQATATAIATARDHLNYNLQNIGGAISSLNSDADFSSALKQYSDDMSQMQKDFQKEQSDAKAGCSNQGTVEYDDGSVQYDEGSIQYNDSSLQYQLNNIPNDIANLQSYITGISNIWYNELGKQVPGITQGDVDSALQNGTSALKAAQANEQDAKNKAAQFDSAAKAILQQADSLAASMHC